MTVKRDPDAILAAWLEEGPSALPEATRRAIAVTTRTTHQGRRLLWVPRRFHMMNPSQRLALAVATIVVAAVGGLSLIGLTQQSGIGGPPSPTPALSPSPAGGTITLTDTGCTWEDNPGVMAVPYVLWIRVRNQTDHLGVFELHWIRPGHTYADGVELVAEVQRRLAAREPWPDDDISYTVDTLEVPAGADTVPGTEETFLGGATAGIGDGPLEAFRKGGNWRWEPGAYGITCSADTGPTGEVLSMFLVGPLQLTAVTPSSGPSASP